MSFINAGFKSDSLIYDEYATSQEIVTKKLCMNLEQQPRNSRFPLPILMDRQLDFSYYREALLKLTIIILRQMTHCKLLPASKKATITAPTSPTMYL